MFKWLNVLDNLKINQRSYYNLPKLAFEADFLLKVSLIILNSGLILKTLTHVSTGYREYFQTISQLKHVIPLSFFRLENNYFGF